uniref:cupin domain-containing protein n=1 Tax=Nocardia cyriacigeorgica TaxID=135487 RepID=UPI002454B1D4
PHRKPRLQQLPPTPAPLATPRPLSGAPPRRADSARPRRAQTAAGRVLVPLSRHRGEPRAYTMTIPATDDEPFLRTHPGHEWLYVLHGRLRVRLGSRDFVMTAGEAAEFDCRIPHWFGATGGGSVQVLSLFGKQGERIHLRTSRE